MDKRAELLRLDFGQMLFDGGWVVGVEVALALKTAVGSTRAGAAAGFRGGGG